MPALKTSLICTEHMRSLTHIQSKAKTMPYKQLLLSSFCCGNTKKQKKTRLLRDKAPRNDNSINVRRHCEESSITIGEIGKMSTTFTQSRATLLRVFNSDCVFFMQLEG
jgi:hypothetical protein